MGEMSSARGEHVKGNGDGRRNGKRRRGANTEAVNTFNGQQNKFIRGQIRQNRRRMAEDNRQRLKQTPHNQRRTLSEGVPPYTTFQSRLAQRMITQRNLVWILFSGVVYHLDRNTEHSRVWQRKGEEGLVSCSLTDKFSTG